MIPPEADFRALAGVNQLRELIQGVGDGAGRRGRYETQEGRERPSGQVRRVPKASGTSLKPGRQEPPCSAAALARY